MVFLNPTNDVAFKKLFGNQNKKEVLINFLNNILERPDGKKITDVIYNDPYNHPETEDAKLSIVDVSATDQQGKHYIIEVQVRSQQGYGPRAQYYSSLAVARQLDKAGKYEQLTPVIFIGVLGFNLFKGKHYLSHHLVLDTITKHNELQLMEWHFIELEKFTKTEQELQADTDKWIFLLKNAKDFNQIPEKLKTKQELLTALEILNKATWSNRELYDYDKRRDEIISWESQLETARVEGLAKGLAKGLAEGLAEGKTQGELQKALAIAQAMLADGIDLHQIARFTGLLIEQISELKKK